MSLCYIKGGMSCSICLHPKLPEIEDALSTGLTVRAAQARYGVSKSAVARHRANCLAPKVAAAARIVTPSPAKAQVQQAKAIVAGQAPTPGEVLSLTGLLERLARSLDRLDSAADAAAGESLHAALAAVTGQLHKGVETAAKLQGLYTDADQPAREKFSITINLPDGVPTVAPMDITPVAEVREVVARSRETHPDPERGMAGHFDLDVLERI